MTDKCHQFLQYFILYQLWIVDLKHVLIWQIELALFTKKTEIFANNLKIMFLIIPPIRVTNEEKHWFDLTWK